MNGPFRIAQADSTGTGGSNKQERIVKITKPYGDQSVVVPLSYDGSVKADLSAIASEKITLVHLGDKLIILFDNHSTVTLEPFYDSTGKPLGDLTVEVSPGRDITSAEFATLFPVTDDQSVLPAAGTGNGSGAQASGANFTTVGVDPLSVGNPLALLGPEDLPGFTINNILTNDFVNDTPTALANDVVALDEDGLPGGNLGGIGDLDPGINGPIFLTGTLGHNYGHDQDGARESTLLVGTGAPSGFTYTVSSDGLVLTVSQVQDGANVDVLRIVLSDRISGNYTIQQLHAIDHAPGGNENDQPFAFHYVVTDSNGDTADGSLGLTVNDDSPTVLANAPITFDEDALPGGNQGGVGDFDPASNGPISASGTLSHSYGADGAGTVLLSGTGAPEGFTYSVDGTGTILTVSQLQNGVSVDVLLIVLGDRTSGDYTITQLHAINHAPGQDENNQDFTFNYTVTDHDGDTAAGTLALTVNDDTPVALSGSFPQEGEGDTSSGSFFSGFVPPVYEVYEDGLTDANSGGQSVGNPEFPNPPTSAIISASDLSGLVSFGADQPGSFHLNPNAAAPALFSKGDPVTYTVSGDTLTASAGGRVVFTLHDNGDQTFTFTLKDQLDHSPAPFYGDYQTLTINLASAFLATDSDGDSVVLDGQLNIAVENDVPVQNFPASVSGSVQEDALTLANSDGHAVGNPEGSDQTTVATGSLSSLVSVGADEPGTFSLQSAPGGLPQITSHGATVQYAVNGDTLTAYVDSNNSGGLDAGDRDIFTLKVSADGSYTFTLLDNIDHLPNVPANDDAQTLTLNLSSVIRFTDSDGDFITLSGGFSVSVEDDIPVVTVTAPDSASNSFFFDGFVENGNAWGTGSGIATNTAGSWTIANSDTGQGGNGAIQLERVGDGYQGMHTSTHGFMVDLDATAHDVKISQTVNGLTNGESYALTFEAGAPFPSSAHLEVWFGGQKVFDLDPTAAMQTYTIDLFGGSGDGSNLLEFRETGTPDNQGTYLANVRMADVIVIDETPGPQADANETTDAAVIGLFNGITAVGTDPDMAPQYATGSAPAVIVTPSFGADGPKDSDHDGKADTDAIVYALTTTNNVDSGLMTTAGQAIHLFSEGNVVVGRYDSDNNGSYDKAAFAVAIDSVTGVVSVAQYVSLQHPDHSSADEGIYLNAGTLGVTATVTDGDGDTATQGVDVSASIKFEDDGPTVVESGTVTYHADEGDIYTPWSHGTTPDDGNADGSYTGWPTQDVPIIFGFGGGPAELAGSVSGAVDFGADGKGGFSFASDTISTLQGLGLTSKGGTLNYAIVGGNTVVAYVDQYGSNGHLDLYDRPVFTLTLNQTSGDFLFTLEDQLDHVSGNGKNTDLQGSNGAVSGLDFGALIVATDGDGDHVTLDGHLTIQVTDDIPKIISFDATDKTVTVDETAGVNPGSNDTTSSTIAALFVGHVANVGQDPDMGNAPQFAVSKDAVVHDISVPGADEPKQEVLSLTIAVDGTDSGLTTTDGHKIYLFNENGIIVGRIDGDGGGIASGGSAADVAAFAISIGQNGKVSVAQYLSIHNNDATTPNDVMTLGSTISAQLAVTDNDGDTVTKSVTIGDAIHFRDDGPTVFGSATSVTVDEDDIATWHAQGTSPNDGSGDGSYTGSPFDNGPGPADVFGTLSGHVNFGADGAGANAYSFTGTAVSAMTALGLTSHGNSLSYSISGDTLTASAGGHSVFTLTVNHTTGAYTFSLFDSLDHVNANGQNTTLETGANDLGQIDFGSILKATDGDGDSVTLTGQLLVTVRDDVPIAHDASAPWILDDDAQSLFPGNFGSIFNGDVFPSVDTVFDFNGTLFTPGADGIRAIAFAGPSGIEAIYKLPSGLAGQETVHYTTTTSGDHTILTAIGDVSGNTVFTLNVDSDGSYVLKVSEPLVHPDHSTTEENLPITIGFTVTDGDGDQDSGSLTFKVNDDTPIVEVDRAGPWWNPASLDTLKLDESIHHLPGDSNATNDNVAGVTGPTLLTSVDATKAIGIVTTPTSSDNHATTIADLFDVNVSFGADGAQAAPVKTYTFTLTDDRGHTVSDGSTDGVETNLIATALAGTPLAGLSEGDRTIYLFKEADGSIVGRVGDDPNGDIALHIVITDSGSGPQMSVEQYLPVQHGNHNSSDESASLKFDDRDASLGITLTVTATDGDGDVASDSRTVTIADHNSSFVKIEDDGPQITSFYASGTVVQDETPGVTGADPDTSNDVSSSGLPTGVLALFDGVANKGVDNDVNNADHNAIGFATSAGSIVNVTADFGTDGGAINNAQVLSLAISGGNGTDSGLKTTDGHKIYLFVENGLIVGRYDGNGSSTVTDGFNNSNHHANGSFVDPAAFAIALGQDGSISIAQYVSLFNPTPGASYDEAATGLQYVQATVTVTDGDGDQISKTADISSNIVFQDDGPTLTVTAPGAINGFDFGAFALNGNAWGTGSGVATGTNGGWTIADANDGHSGGALIGNTGAGAIQLERVGDGYEGMHSSTNGFMVDLDASPHDVKISQQVNGLVTGQVYDLRFEAGAPFPGQAHMEVWFGGVKVRDVAPNSQMTAYDIQLIGGSGDGSNLLEFRETGTPDNQGTYLANVSVGEIVIDETAGNQPNTNDVDPNALFNAVINQGTDADMTAGPQFAAGISAVVNVAANFGADGPSAAQATVYSLSTANGMDSGLTTTGGQPIHLFNETYSGVGYVVGRYDSNGDQSITSADDAAFAFRVDPTTGVLSLVQYVSLHQPDTLSNNEGVFLNTNSLSVSVTITDGDGDTATRSADISANIRFDDDGPQAVLAATSATLTIDETAGQDAPTDDVAVIADHAALFGAIAGTPIEIAQSQSALVSTTGTVYGADGQGAAPVFALNVSFNGVDSGLDATDGRSVFLFKEGNLIVGREGTAGDTADSNGSVAFAISLDSSSGVLTVAEYTALYHHNPLDPNEAASPLSIANNVLQATVTVTDGDGDTSVASVGIGGQIHFLDDGPTASYSGRLTLQETANADGSFHEQTAHGHFVFDGGADGAAVTSVDYGFAVGKVNDPDAPTGSGLPFPLVSLTSDGHAISFSHAPGDPLTLIGTRAGDGVKVFELHVTDAATGAYDFTQYAPIDHPDLNESGAADPLRMKFTFTVTDGDGDTATNSNQIDILDDAPTASYSGRLTLQETANADGSFHEQTAHGHFVFDGGADGAVVTSVDYGLAAGRVSDPEYASFTTVSLTSAGHAISFSHAPGDPLMLIGTRADDGVKVFELHVTDAATGAYDFTQYAPIDHPDHNESGVADPLRMKFTFTVTDGDGDTATNSNQIDILDDAPTAQYSGRLTLQETANADGSFHEQTAHGHFVFDGGADGAAVTSVDYGFAAGKVNDPDAPTGSGFPLVSLTSDGHAISFSHAPGDPLTLIGTRADDGVKVFELHVTDAATGAYDFTQYAPIDHPDHNESGVADPLRMKFTFTVTDGDGDTATNSNQIDILDDAPAANSGTVNLGDVYEDGLTAANSYNHQIVGNPEAGHTDTSVTVHGADLVQLVNFGADGEGSFGFNAAAEGALSGLSSDGSPIHYHIIGDTLSGITADGRTIFTLVDDHSGSFVFTLTGNIDHAGSGDAGTLTLNLASLFTATDADGDSVVLNGGLNVVIENDVPVVAAQTNLIVNGSFEDGHTDLGASDWNIYGALPGWTSGADNIPFEVQTGGAGGIAAQNGTALVELDGDTAGNPSHTPQGTPDPVHTDATIQQTIAGTEAGQTYELTFWYAPRPGQAAGNDSGLNVLWNGAIVHTIDSTNQPAGWQQITVFVEGTGPGDVLGFQGVGAEDEFGALIDNISLVAAVAVDEDGLNGPNAFGNHDSQPGDIVVPNGDGDNNEATATGLLDIKWGADSADSGADTTDNLPGEFGTLVQDHPDSAGDRSVTFGSNALAAFSGTLTAGHLTSHGEDIQLSFNADHTILYGTAGAVGVDARTVFEVSLSDDGSGSFRFVLKDRLDHAIDNNENNINLSFNYVATDSDGDSAPGTFSVVVNDDVPVLVPNVTASGSVNESDIPVPVVSNVNLTFQSDTGGHAPNLSGTHLSVSGGSGIVVDSFGGVNVLGGPDQNPGAKPLIFTADVGTTFTLNSILIGTFGATLSDLVTLKGTDVNGNTVTTTVHVNAVGYLGAEPTTLFNGTASVFNGVQLTKLEIDPPASLAGRLVVDNLSLTETTTPAHNYTETVVNLAPLVDVGPDQPGTWSLTSFASQNVGNLSYNGTQIAMSSDGHTITGAAGGTTVFTVTLSADGHAVFDLFKPVDGGLPVQIDFSNFVTVTDYDGDSVKLGTGEFLINVNSVDHLPTVSGTTVSVSEAGLPQHDGLPAGSGESADGLPNNNSDHSETHTGTIAIALGDTPSSITINGHNVTGVAGQTFAGAFGSLTITNVTATEIDYSYTLAHSSTGNGTHDDFVVKVTDTDNQTSTATLTVNIVNDAPHAYVDNGSVTEGALLQVDSANGVLSNDISGADGYAIGGAVVGVAAGNDTSSAVSGHVGNDVGGAHGTLHLNADGSYSYQSTANDVTSDMTDTFVYTIQDGDGDLSTTTLTIHLDDVTLVADNQTGTVYEKALDTQTTSPDLGAGTVTGSDPADTRETVTGQLNVTGATGYTPVDLTTAHGIFHLAADGSYTYTLTSPFETTPHSDGANNTLPGAESFTYMAQDANGNTVTGTVKIDVVDDAPVVTHAAYVGAVNEADLGGSDPQYVRHDSGGLGLNFGADGPGTLRFASDSNGDLIKPTGYSSDGVALDYIVRPANGGNAEELVAFKQGQDENSPVFIVEIFNQADPQYSFTLFQNLTHSAMGTDVQTLSFNVVATDSDGDSVTQTVNVQVTDDVPHAVADTATIQSADQIVAGNVIGNDAAGADFPLTVIGFDKGFAPGGIGGNGGSAGFFDASAGGTGGAADIFGAGGAGGTGGNAAYITNIGQPVAGQYGTLTLNGDGTYTYQANPNVSGDDLFHYTVMDNDGDTSTATLTITVFNGQPTVAAAIAQVDEAALDTSTTGSDLNHGTMTGSDPGSAAETTTGTVTFSDPDGAHVTNIAGATSSAVGVGAVTVQGAYGLLQIDQDGHYTYTLTKPFTTDPAANNGSELEAGKDVFTYTVTDAFGNTSSSTITIDVVDDIPQIASISAPQSVDAQDWTGTWQPVFGADGANATAAVGLGFGGAYTATATNSVIDGHQVDKVTDGTITFYEYTVQTGAGATMHAFADTGGNQKFFELTVDANGHYDFHLDMPADQMMATHIGMTSADVSDPYPNSGRQLYYLAEVSGGSPVLAPVGSAPTDPAFTASAFKALGVFSPVLDTGVTSTGIGVVQDGGAVYLGANDYVAFQFSAPQTEAVIGVGTASPGSSLETFEVRLWDTRNGASITEIITQAAGAPIRIDAADWQGGQPFLPAFTDIEVKNVATPTTADAQQLALSSIDYANAANSAAPHVLDFNVTVTDGDGDTSAPADLAIALPPSAPSGHLVAGGAELVYEAGLGSGSHHGESGYPTVDHSVQVEFTARADAANVTLAAGGLVTNLGAQFGHLVWETNPAGTVIYGYQATTPGTTGSLVVSFAITAVDGTAIGTNDSVSIAAGQTATVTITETLYDDILGNNGGSGLGQVYVVATDATNPSLSTGTQIAVQVGVVDDVPVAHDDTADVQVGHELVANVISGVPGADTAGADSSQTLPLTVIGVAAGADTADVSGGIGQPIGGAHGTLMMYADGTYSYTANPDDSSSSGPVTDTFHYTIQDADGSTSTADLTITIEDSVPSFTLPAAGDGVTVVHEAGLPARGSEPAGSDENANSETASGTISFHSADGVSEISLGGHVLGAAATTFGPETLPNGTQGSLTASYTYNATTGDGTIHYSFTLADNTSGDDTTANYAVVVKDAGGDPAPAGTLTIDIVDDVPTAHDDTVNTLVTGAIGIDVFQNDVSGADGVDTATGIALGTGAGHGTVVDNHDGTFTYTPNAGYNGDDHFTYTITDGDGDTSTATVMLSDVHTNSIPTAGTESVALNEDGLPHGLAGGPGDSGVTGTSHTGTLPADFSTDGAASSGAFNFTQTSGAVLDSNGHAVTSGGIALSYLLSGGTLYATTDGTTSGAAFSVSLNTSTGGYTVTESKPLDHPGHDADGLNNGPETSYEDNLTINVGYQVTDSNGDHAVTDGQLAITINDDTPVAVSEVPVTVDEKGAQDFNGAFVLDFSGSISNSEYGDMLNAVKAAGDEIFTNVTGSVSIQLVAFSSSADAFGPFTTQTAFDNEIADLLANRPFDGGTNYTAGIENLMANYAPVAGANNQVFFLSDGNPTDDLGSGGASLDDDTASDWNNFVNNGTAPISVTTIGVGNELNDARLHEVDVDGHVDTVDVADFSSLIGTLVTLVGVDVSGNVMANGDGFGADGGHIKSILIDGTTYAFDGDHTITHTGTDPGTHLVANDGKSITVTTEDVGGSLTFYFADEGTHLAGDYTYTAPTNVAADETETFHYTLTDNDGDTVGADLTINVHDVPNAPPTLALAGDYVLDQFGSKNYSNNDGTANWASSWAEANDDNDSNHAKHGAIQISSNELQFSSSIDGGETITRDVDLSGVSAATLTFSYNPDNLTGGKDVRVEVWNDTAGTWVLLGTLSGDGGETNFTASLSGDQLGSDAAIRFRAEGDWNSGNHNGSLSIDDVKISYTASTDFSAIYTENAVGAAISQNSAIADTDDSLMSAAQIVLTNEQAGDYLTVGGTQLHDGSTGSVNGIGYMVTDNGSQVTVNLTGNQALSVYQNLLNDITYASGSDNPSTAGRIIDVTVTDAHGNVSNAAHTTIDVVAVNDAPVASNDTVITNAGNSPFSIPDWVLLLNDSDPDSSHLAISGIGGASNGDSDSHANGVVTYTDSNSAFGNSGGSFNYTVSDGSLTATGHVSIKQDPGNMSGASGNEIFIGGNNNDFIAGNGGNDVFVGRGGADVLIGETGVDHFAYLATTDGGGGSGDHIVNFTSGQDVIDILGAAFGGLTPTDNVGSLFGSNATSNFAAGEKFHFDTANHTLYYDAGGTVVALAHLDAGHAIAATDVHIV